MTNWLRRAGCEISIGITHTKAPLATYLNPSRGRFPAQNLSRHWLESEETEVINYWQQPPEILLVTNSQFLAH
jgi:hypothetical protein